MENFVGTLCWVVFRIYVLFLLINAEVIITYEHLMYVGNLPTKSPLWQLPFKSVDLTLP